MSSEVKDKYTGLEVAVIGMACNFPDAENIHEFWQNIRGGKESIQLHSLEEVLESGVSSALANDPNYVFSSGGQIRDKFGFDAAFFNYTVDEALLMDPQVRLMHECVYNALLDAGYPASSFNGKIGLFTGCSANPLWEILSRISNTSAKIGNWSADHYANKDFGATLISYKLGLQGPSINIDTGCSTSLVTVHLAVRSLLMGECTIAVAGGASLNVGQEKGYLYQDGLIASRDGHCRAFDHCASGTIFGQGSGMVILKTLDKAIADKDRIYAVIKGSAVNNDGNRKGGYTAPSIQGQVEVIQEALRLSSVQPESIGFVETHGTGTHLGDPIEVRSLTKAFNSSKRNYCYLGALKANIGHLDAAAGIAGLIKTILVIQNKTIPPLVNFELPNPLLEIEDSPFLIPRESKAWEAVHPRRAGVSSFGIGGTNVHIILEEFTEPEPEVSRPVEAGILLLSAKSGQALERIKTGFYKHLLEHESVNPADLAYTLQTGRENLPYKESAVFKSRGELLAAFEYNHFKSALLTSKDKKIIFAFPGQGMQYAWMGKELYIREELFRCTLQECFAILREINGKNFEDILFPELESDDQIHQTVNSQPILFSFQYAMAKLMQAWGIRPDAFIGHSIGEYVAACLAGVFSLRDALYIVAKRAEFMQQMDKGDMLAINLNWKEVLKFKPATLSFASINSPHHSVLSGNSGVITSLLRQLAEKGISAHVLNTSHAFHSGMMHRAADWLETELATVQFGNIQIPFISNVTGDWISAPESQSRQYWSRQLESTVQLHKGISKILEAKDAVILEIGPGNSLSTFIKNNENFTEKHQAFSLVRHAKAQSTSDWEYLLNRLSDLWLVGVEIDWKGFYGGQKLRTISLPGYPFVHQEFVLDTGMLKRFLEGRHGGDVVKKPIADWFYLVSWQKSKLLWQPRASKGRWLVTGLDKEIVSRLANYISGRGNEVYSLVPGLGEQLVKRNVGFEIDRTNVAHYFQVMETLDTQETPLTIIDTSFLGGENLPADPESINAEACTHLLYLSKSLSRCIRAPRVLLNCITSNNYDVLGNESLRLHASVVTGMLKVISQEYFHVAAKNIDLPAGDVADEGYLESMYEEAALADGNAIVALRNKNKRWIPFYEKVTRSIPYADSKFKIERNGVYMITGGVGKVGFILAKQLCRMGGKVALLGRSQPEWELTDDDQERRRRLNELKTIDADIHYIAADVTQVGALEKAISEIEHKLGPIKGVFHLATAPVSSTEQNLIQQIDLDDCFKQFAPKTEGVRNIKSVFEKRPPEFVILFSSLATVLGGLGYFAYAAANAYLDGFARMNNGKNGTHWAAINWDAWDLSGSVDASDDNTAITEKEGCEVIEKLYSWLHDSQLIVSVSNLEERIDKWVRKKEDKPVADNAPLPELERPGVSDTVELPENNWEEALLALWKNLFGYKTIGVKDDFFELGGDSLKALHLINAIRAKFGKDVSLSDFFSNPSIRGVSECIASGPHNAASVPTTGKKEAYTLSSAQKRLFFLHEFDKASLAYNFPKVVRLTSPINKEKLSWAFQRLIERHDILRTSIRIVNNNPVQVIAENINFEITHFYSYPSGTDAIIAQFVRPFDLGTGPLFRVGLIEVDSEDHLLIIDMHHIITDGVSQLIFIKDFVALFKGEELPELKLHYKDYAEWQQSQVQQARIAGQKAFWLKEYATLPEALEMPADHARPLIRSHRGAFADFELSVEETDSLREIAVQEKTTLFIVILSIANVLLSKLSNQADIVIGTTTAGRQHVDLEGILGMFVNTLPLRNYPHAKLSFREFLRDVKCRTLSCFDHQDFQYEDLIDQLKLERNTGRNPLFDIMLSYENFEELQVEIPGLTLQTYQVDRTISKFDLTLTAVEANKQLYLSFEYATDLFEKETIERFVDYFKKVVSAVKKDAGVRLADVDILSAFEKNQLLVEFNATASGCPAQTIVDLFTRQAIDTPDQIAVVYGDIRLTYRALLEQSDRLASYLISLGVTAETLIPVMMERSPEVIIGILGILKAGGTYVPIDADYPQERIDYIVQDSDARLLLTQSIFLGRFKSSIHCIALDAPIPYDDAPENYPAFSLHAAQLAYVIYTSGTTGWPKGVMIQHNSLVNYIRWAAGYYVGEEKATFPLYTSISFDLTVTSIFTSLVTGNTIVVYAEADEGTLIEKVIADNKSSIVKLTPSHLKIIRDSEMLDNLLCSRVKKFIVGGEKLDTQLANVIHDKFGGRVEIYNEYGPTEATVGCMIHKYIPEEVSLSVLIGKPIDNTRLYIVDQYNNLQPKGVAGELLICGIQLARGYVNYPELTASKFITDPFAADRTIAYRTGDLARWLPDGNMEFLGRIDDQIKIRGFRVELGEIEYHLVAHPSVKDAVVVAKEKEGNTYLAAYYVSDEDIKAEALRSHLLSTLPDYMVPAYFNCLEKIPLTPNGKADRKALPDPQVKIAPDYVPPSNELEEKMVEIWAEILRIEPEIISVTASFFELGGHSLITPILIARIKKELNVSFHLTILFQFQTVAALSGYIAKKQAEEVSFPNELAGYSLPGHVL